MRGTGNNRPNPADHGHSSETICPSSAGLSFAERNGGTLASHGQLLERTPRSFALETPPIWRTRKLKVEWSEPGKRKRYRKGMRRSSNVKPWNSSFTVGR